MRRAPLLALAALIPASAAHSIALAQDAGPSQDLARQAAETAVRACERMGFKTMATVVDATGKPVAAMTAAPELSRTLAPGSVKRARVAAYFQTASSEIAQRVRMDTGLYYAVHNDPRLASPEPGGVPLSGPEKPRGAIGVAGASDPAADEACAREGAQKVAQRLK